MTLVLKQYGITLKRLSQEDIEIVRQGRNQLEVRSKMEYKKIISKEKQLEWFRSINNSLNYYFLISYEDRPVGVVNCKDVNSQNRLGEGGIFIFNRTSSETPIPVFASLIILDFIFNELQFGDFSVIRIMKDNLKAQEYNRILGYVCLPNQHRIKNQYYVLTKETFNTKAEKLRVAARNYSESDGKLKVSGVVSDTHLEIINEYIRKNF